MAGRRTLITYQGRTLNVRGWAAEAGISPGTLSHRLRNGETLPHALRKTGRGRPAKRTLTYDGRTQTIPEWAAERGIADSLIRTRLARGATAAEALAPLSAPRWTNREEAFLRANYSKLGVCATAAELGRSEAAVRNKALGMGIELRAMRFSMAELSKVTGYDHASIRHVCRLLGIKLRRVPGNTRAFGIAPHQVDRIVGYLRTLNGARVFDTRDGEWGGPKPDRCERCGTADRPHRGRGMCEGCYSTMRGVWGWCGYDRCVQCGTTKSRHATGGKCKRCYVRVAQCVACEETGRIHARGMCERCYSKLRYELKPLRAFLRLVAEANRGESSIDDAAE